MRNDAKTPERHAWRMAKKQEIMRDRIANADKEQGILLVLTGPGKGKSRQGTCWTQTAQGQQYPGNGLAMQHTCNPYQAIGMRAAAATVAAAAATAAAASAAASRQQNFEETAATAAAAAAAVAATARY